MLVKLISFLCYLKLISFLCYLKLILFLCYLLLCYLGIHHSMIRNAFLPNRFATFDRMCWRLISHKWKFHLTQSVLKNERSLVFYNVYHEKLSMSSLSACFSATFPAPSKDYLSARKPGIFSNTTDFF